VNVPRSIGSAAASLTTVATSRLELFSTELSLEKSRLGLLLVCILVGCGSLLLAVGGLCLLAVVLTPVGSRALTAALCVVVLLLIAALCVLVAGLSLRDGRFPFANTCAELRKDLQCLGSAVRRKD